MRRGIEMAAKYVIIGGGVASISCIEGIRRIDPAGVITLVTAEPYKTYCRPLISYLLEGKTSVEKMKYRADKFYEDNRVRVITGTKAERIDAQYKTVSLSDGSVLQYDKLLCATGSVPFVPPFEGLDTVPKKFSFLTLDDTLELERNITPGSRVFIVGAGLIGLKCAERLHGKLCRGGVGSITVCDLAPQVLASILDADGGALVAERLMQNGIKLMLGDTVTKFDGNKAAMKSGETVEFDVLVLAVGVRPNTSLIRDAGGEVGRGIITGSDMRTSLPDIYAAGDCTECYDITTGANRVLAILPNAYMQGECAGINMAGGNADFTNAIPMNSIGFFGLHIATAGAYTGEVYEERTGGGLKRLYVRDNRLVGFIIIGDVSRAGIYTALIRNKTPLDSLDFDLIKKYPSLFAFSKTDRLKMLGGVV
jgi:NAD(P)H-nitrite reductase large subunit